MELQRRGNHAYLTESGNDVVIVAAIDGRDTEIRKFPLYNRMTATMRVSVDAGKSENRYQYTIKNDSSSTDAIKAVSLVVPADLGRFKAFFQLGASRPNWGSMVSFVPTAAQAELSTKSQGRYVTWVARPSPGGESLAPGQSASGFNIETNLKPGFTTVYLPGALPNIPDEYADLPGVDLGFMAGRRWTDAHLLTIGPQFSSFSSLSDVLENLRAGVARLSECQGQTDFLSALSKILNHADSWASLKREINDLPRTKAGGIEDEIVNAVRITAEQSK